jgi:hypothetical protein
VDEITWFKVDDGFWSHEKVVELSAEAGWLWTRAGSYCAHQLTDGVVKSPILTLLGGSREVAAELVSAGLWDASPGGYRFHDWDKYQPTRDEVESKREAWKERQRKARARHLSPEESRSDTERDSRRESTSPVPSRPVPSHSSSTKKSASASRRKPEVPLPDDWTPKPSHVKYAVERGVDGRHEEGQFRAHAAANDRRQRDWDAAFRSWLGNARPGKTTPTQQARRTVMLATELVGELES